MSGSTGSSFGWSVAVSGSYLVVGSRSDSDAGFQAGSAYIYNLTDDGSWNLVQKIVAPDAASGDGFGYAVAISGHRLVVGAPWDNVGVGADQGSVYCYKLTTDGSATWNFVQKIVAPDAEAGDRFGYSVATSDNHLVVGGGSYAGSAYVYILTTEVGTWDYVQNLVPSDSSAPRFGWSVAISGNHIVVGAERTDSYGAAYVFEKNTSDYDGEFSWVQVVKVVPDEPERKYDDDYAYYYLRADEDDVAFGFSVAIDANVVVVGAPYDNSPWPDAGSAYVYVLNSEGLWTHAQTIVPHDTAPNDRFGISVAASGETVVVGAFGDDDAGGESGSAYIFRTTDNGTTWDYDQKLVASDAAADTYFGRSVAFSGNHLAVSALRAPPSTYLYAVESCAEMALSDAGGDGWNGANYTFTSVESGEVVETGTLALGSSGSDEVCLLDGVYALEVGGGDFDDDISWTFVTMAGGAPYGPTELVVDSGDIFESATPVPTPSPTFSTQAPSST